MASDLVKEFNKKIRIVKTPNAAYKAVSEYSEEMFSRLGAIALMATFPSFVRKFHNVRKQDKYFNILNKHGHKVDKVQKKTAIQMVRLLEKEANKLVYKLTKD